MGEPETRLVTVPSSCSELVISTGSEITTSLPASNSVQPGSEPATSALALYDFWRTVDRSNNEHYAEEIACFMQRPAIQTILDRITLSDDKDTSSSALVPFWPFGYVYAAWNPLFPDLIKIGATMRQKPYMRVAELSTSGVPEPFQLVDSIACKDPFALEKEIHAHYNAVRKYGRKKEFFIVSREEILEYFHIMSFKATLLQSPASVIIGQDAKKRKQEETQDTNSQDKQQQDSQSAEHSQTHGENHVTRRHRKTFVMEEDEAKFKASIQNFINHNLQPSLDGTGFISARKLKKLFDSTTNSYQNINDIVFFKELKRQIVCSQFPGMVIYKRRGDIYGYAGLVTKQA